MGNQADFILKGYFETKMSAKGRRKNVTIIKMNPAIRYFMVSAPNTIASLTGMFLICLTGMKMSTPKRLNTKCTIAIVTAASFLNIAASNAVIVVPIFAPKMNGNACFILILPVATTGTIREVVTELDCNAMVTMVPKKNDL